jgi:hypothetical protein
LYKKKSEIIKERKKKMEFKKLTNNEIRIRHTANGGLIVKVGCAELAFSGYKMMLEAMEEFYKDPHAMEKEYNDNQGQDLADTAECEDCGPEPMADTPRTQPLGPPPSRSGGNRR